jgi:hypothetical protein
VLGFLAQLNEFPLHEFGYPTTDPANTHTVFKAYDVRGTVPEQLDEELARRTGAAFVPVVGAETVVIGYDMRPARRGWRRRSPPAPQTPAPTW